MAAHYCSICFITLAPGVSTCCLKMVWIIMLRTFTKIPRARVFENLKSSGFEQVFDWQNVAKHSVMRMNVVAPEKLKNLKPTQFICPIDLH
jgi:hypothetical protein